MRLLPNAFVLLCTAGLLHASSRPNVLLICVDDLRPELSSFGADYIQSPHIDRLAAAGRAFHRHYVNAPTCGASRYTLLTGRYGPPGNHAMFQRAEQMADDPDSVTPSMPEWFRRHGYTTVSVGKVSHHPGGWGGSDWQDRSIVEMPGAWDRRRMPTGDWQHPRGVMHGLAHGEQRVKGETRAIQSAEGPDTIYPDGLIADEAIAQLRQLADQEKPFFLAIGLMKPHLPFGSPRKYMAPYETVALPPIPHPDKPNRRTTWHGSGEFFNQYDHDGRDPRIDADYADEVRRHYAACVTFIDRKIGDIMQQVENVGMDRNTIVVVWGDHGWHLGEHGIWGKHSLFEESLRSPLILCAPGLKQPGENTHAVVETVDVFPTLCELAGLPVPEFSHGTSLVPLLTDPSVAGRTAYAYLRKAETIRTATHRMILHADGFIELYDHRSDAGENENVADQNPGLCDRLEQQIRSQRTR